MLQQSGRFRLEQVVVTPALRLWHSYRALELVYRDVYHSQLNDRYAAKRDQFRELGKWAYVRMRQTGVGVTPTPVPRAAPPELEASGGSMTADGIYYAAIAWVNAAGEEGACSSPNSVEINQGGFITRPGLAPQDDYKWNIYAGTAPDSLSRQNDAPLKATTVWIGGWKWDSGIRPGAGQTPFLMHPLPRILQRG
jgi:hypothetical protein